MTGVFARVMHEIGSSSAMVVMLDSPTRSSLARDWVIIGEAAAEAALDGHDVDEVERFAEVHAEGVLALADEYAAGAAQPGIEISQMCWFA